jgi:hypothetical protein
VTEQKVARNLAERKGNPSNRLVERRRRGSLLEAFEALVERNGGKLTMSAREILDVLAQAREHRYHRVSLQLAIARGEAEGRLRVDRTGKPNTYWLTREP